MAMYAPSFLKWKVLFNCSCPNENMVCIRPAIYTKPVECIPGMQAALLDSETFFFADIFAAEQSGQQQQHQEQEGQHASVNWPLLLLLLLQCVAILLAALILFGCRVRLGQRGPRSYVQQLMAAHTPGNVRRSAPSPGAAPIMITVLSRGLPTPTTSTAAATASGVTERVEETDEHKHWWGKRSITCAICRRKEK